MVSWFGRIHPLLGDCILDLYLGMGAAGIMFARKLRAMQLQVESCIGDRGERINSLSRDLAREELLDPLDLLWNCWLLLE